MPLHHQHPPDIKSLYGKRLVNSRRLSLSNKPRYKIYKQIIHDHFNIHSHILVDAGDADMLKIHILPKTKIAQRLKKCGLPTYIRRRDLGFFAQCLQRTLESLARRIEFDEEREGPARLRTKSPAGAAASAAAAPA